jgi:hypothetical protein
MNEAEIIHSRLCREKHCDNSCYKEILKLIKHCCYLYKEIYSDNFFLEPLAVCNDWLFLFMTKDNVSIPICKMYAKNEKVFMSYLFVSIRNFVSRGYYLECKARAKEKEVWHRKQEMTENSEGVDRPFCEMKDKDSVDPEDRYRREKSSKVIADLVDKLSTNMQLAFLNFMLDDKDEPDMYLKHVSSSNRYKLVSRMKKTLFRNHFKQYAIDEQDLLFYSNSKYLSELCAMYSSYK